MTSEMRALRRRKVRLILVGGLGGVVLTAVAGGVSGLYADDRVPLWGFVLVLALVAAVAVPLLVLGVREFVGVIQQDVLAPYGVEAPARAAPLAVASILVVGLLAAVLVTDLITGSVRWVVAAVLAVVVVVLYLFAWRAGSDSRRRVQQARRDRGYLVGEQPWSWWAHAGYGALFAVMLPLQIWNAVRSEAWSWFFWAGSVMFTAMLVSIGWSATQKWRRERRGVTRAGETA
ncbi:hypothetical protein [Nocardioides zeae]|uniref:Uncharacterized protein n=1 Tax=Nocardioides zeae TaxID=1457234 RepID=A0A6P0HPJ7_9ACTN|nr:hypothetical protein [Nocardioides zeae]NEN79535.1 hypothetical protein [Nocardioides zeae]